MSRQPLLSVLWSSSRGTWNESTWEKNYLFSAGNPSLGPDSVPAVHTLNLIWFDLFQTSKHMRNRILMSSEENFDKWWEGRLGRGTVHCSMMYWKKTAEREVAANIESSSRPCRETTTKKTVRNTYIFTLMAAVTGIYTNSQMKAVANLFSAWRDMTF